MCLRYTCKHGCAVLFRDRCNDNDQAHTYTFPFDPNPEWSEFYASAPEIQEYFMDFYRKHDLEPFVVLNTEVMEAEWHDLEGLWHVTLKNRKDGTTFFDKCNVLINGSGVLTKWKW